MLELHRYFPLVLLSRGKIETSFKTNPLPIPFTYYKDLVFTCYKIRCSSLEITSSGKKRGFKTYVPGIFRVHCGPPPRLLRRTQAAETLPRKTIAVAAVAAVAAAAVAPAPPASLTPPQLPQAPRGRKRSKRSGTRSRIQTCWHI